MKTNRILYNATGCNNVEDACKFFKARRTMTEDEFNQIAIRSKEDVLAKLAEMAYNIDKNDDRKNLFGDELDLHNDIEKRAIEIIARFYYRVEDMEFFEHLEPWWCYQFSLDEMGAVLYLRYIDNVLIYDAGNTTCIIDSSVDYVKMKAKDLTVSEYAKLYNVSEITVRQWIRRGKLRCAFKAGNEWRVPELSKKVGRGYTNAYYIMDSVLENEPIEYPFLKGVKRININQNKKDKKKFDIYLQRENDNPKLESDFQMDTKEREGFEHYLISHPLCKADSKEILSFGGFHEQDYSYLL